MWKFEARFYLLSYTQSESTHYCCCCCCNTISMGFNAELLHAHMVVQWIYEFVFYYKFSPSSTSRWEFVWCKERCPSDLGCMCLIEWMTLSIDLCVNKLSVCIAIMHILLFLEFMNVHKYQLEAIRRNKHYMTMIWFFWRNWFIKSTHTGNKSPRSLFKVKLFAITILTP